MTTAMWLDEVKTTMKELRITSAREPGAIRALVKCLKGSLKNAVIACDPKMLNELYEIIKCERDDESYKRSIELALQNGSYFDKVEAIQVTREAKALLKLLGNNERAAGYLWRCCKPPLIAITPEQLCGILVDFDYEIKMEQRMPKKENAPRSTTTSAKTAASQRSAPPAKNSSDSTSHDDDPMARAYKRMVASRELTFDATTGKLIVHTKNPKGTQ
ncbi:hypothetical protein FBU59_000341 [Linderina macrospora]|uniref:Uncharacterized protein n=1 Tax=Linderina macrospora TaxID=4868 RepID=A0ACC1JH51_9FUNG|nr:hypothetical protein FBU59_000341 [Linderina macrospora]